MPWAVPSCLRGRFAPADGRGPGLRYDFPKKPIVIGEMGWPSHGDRVRQVLASTPHLFATEADWAVGDYSIITRDDGKKQWAYKGKPLYHWANDRRPGDATGDGFMGVWHTAKP